MEHIARRMVLVGCILHFTDRYIAKNGMSKLTQQHSKPTHPHDFIPHSDVGAVVCYWPIQPLPPLLFRQYQTSAHFPSNVRI